MSVQMPQRPEGIKTNGSSDLTPVRPGVASSPTVTITNRALGTAAQVSLSRTARLAEGFHARQSAHATEAGLLHTQAVLDASHTALRRESHIYDKRV